MPKRSVLLVLLVIVIGLFVMAWPNLKNRLETASQPRLTDGQIVTAKLGSKDLIIEVVTSTEGIRQGLSDRTEIGTDGMLFVMGRTTIPRFWMRNMLFDLDLIWLLDDKVVDITPNVPHPAPGTPENELIIYPAPVPVNQVLEVAAGSAANWGITVGDQLEIK